jgi:hypothetical protein
VIDTAGNVQDVPHKWVRRWIDRLIWLFPEGRALPEEVWQPRHRGILILLWVHVVAIAVYAVMTGNTVGHAAVEAGGVAVVRPLF